MKLTGEGGGSMPQGSISIAIPDESIALRELDEWFRADYDLRGKISYKEKPVQPGQMGEVIEAIVIAVGSSGAATTLIRQFFTWLGRREEGHTIHLILKDDKGREANVNVNGLKDSDAIIQETFAFFSANASSE